MVLRDGAVLDEYDREKVLFTCTDAFFTDFACNDIRRDLEADGVFTIPDLDAIYDTRQSEVEKIERLFYMLVIRDQTKLERFSNVLRKKYSWLADLVELQLRNHIRLGSARNDDQYYEKIRNLRTELPGFTDNNVHRCEYLWKIRQKLLKLERFEYLVVDGSLSQGKRWIVMDAICSYQVMRRMDGNIFWINCGRCKTAKGTLELLEKLYILTQPHHNDTMPRTNYKDINNKILSYKESFRQLFSKGVLRDSLVVLIDVQNSDILNAFHINCRMLITTKNKELLQKIPNLSQEIEINQGLSLSEGLELFTKVIGDPDLPAEALEVCRLSRQNPFVISLIAINLKVYKSDRKRWIYWKNKLEKRSKHDFLRKPIEESVNHLKAINPTLCELFKKLVIFSDDVNIPLRVLQQYWNLPDTRVEELIEQLDALYLIQTIYINGERYCSIHNLYYSYLSESDDIKPETKQKWHEQLVNSYGIIQALENRKEPIIWSLPNDNYFYYYIGKHLKESGKHELFPLLYFDFGFLEQKLRYSGSSNTLGDFKQYSELIARGDRCTIFMDELTDFLAFMEELLHNSGDTCLLQYALIRNDVIKLEAQKQARIFKDRMWFDDLDHSVKYRQIIKLSGKPKHIYFVEPNSSLVATADNSIILVDMSYTYTAESTVYLGHTNPISDLQLFLSDYFVSIDESGLVNVWSLKETEISRRRSSRQEEFTLAARQDIQTPCALQANRGTRLQSIDNGSNKITSILISEEGTDLRMLAATVSGEILIYLWSDAQKKFELRKSQTFKTNEKNIVKIMVVHNLLMTVTDTGHPNFFSLIDNSRDRHEENFPNEPPVDVYLLPSSDGRDMGTACVIFASGICQLRLRKISNKLSVERLPDYDLNKSEQNFITCSAITDDNNYLMLGTKKGIIVLDPKTNREILRSSISDNLTSINVCSVEQSEIKYMLISATKKGDDVIYVHGICFKDNLMQWSTNKIGSPMNGRDTTVAWFRGGTMFDVCESGDDEYTLVAVDLKNLVHTKHSSDRFEKSTYVETFENANVTQIAIGATKKFVGCNDGNVYRLEPDTSLLMSLGRSIKYLRYFEEFGILIAGTSTHYHLYTDQKETHRESILIQNTFVYDSKYIVIVKIDGSFEFLMDVRSHELHLVPSTITDIGRVTSSDCINDKIALSTSQHLITILQIHMDSRRNLPFIKYFHMINNIRSVETIAITEIDKLLLAVGYEDGKIELYDVFGQSSSLIKVFKSHESSVNLLRFSPWHLNKSGCPNIPIVLVSLSESICFWDIQYALNNKIERTNLRSSQRFNRKSAGNSSPKDTETNSLTPTKHNGAEANSLTVPNGNSSAYNGNFSSVQNGFAHLSVNAQPMANGNVSDVVDNGYDDVDAGPCNVIREWMNPWIGKVGPSGKRELLSCIKFVGSSAEKLFTNEQFTTFITIDNEGEVYFLKTMNLLDEHSS